MLKSGVPVVGDITLAEKSNEYSELSTYSQSYLANNRENLATYRWIKDSFNQWSRIYEYPYCYEKIAEFAKSDVRILDAGCGVTFFPFFLNQRFTITCVDQDDYVSMFKAINKKQNTSVEFIRSSLNSLPFPDNSFDVLYCISVLEHTDNYNKILDEFKRVLKPGGLLVVTFDIALNKNDWGLAIPAARALIQQVNGLFELSYSVQDFDRDISEQTRYSTAYAEKNMAKELLPWPPLTLKNAIRNLISIKRLSCDVNLTFCNIHALNRQ
jgi:SAM-dependent methyltransferase